MSRDYELYLEDILTACARILRYTEGIDFDRFTNDDLVYDAVLRNIEIIGEAAKNVPMEIRLQHPDVDWRRIAGMRDIVAHRYFSIHDEIVWDVIQNKIPELQTAIRRIIGK